ncbi:polysaccharide pyruvyl transferase family protein [Klugiella xanthotipulae]|uniref:polysaccharide pyruvyl transferase family protein n=1 Tax=Klugiella xanthotipulae TaxID=244735 RepID=UPI001476C056|nr:polysaccharide pyruvyl transferase family protein [Klugiella xanthotipulae]
MKNTLRPFVRRVWNTRLYAWAVRWADVLVFSLSGWRRPSRSGYTLVLSPAGDGNIGDHAVLNSFIAHTPGDIHVVLFAARSLVHPHLGGDDAQRVSVSVERHVVMSPPLFRIRSIWRFSRLLRGASSFHIHGTDTMDGGHIAASLARLSLCNLARRAGVPTAVLGFSWRPDVPRVVADACVGISGHSTLYPRDPQGFRRLEALGAQNLTQAADVAFAHQKSVRPSGPLGDWLDECERTATPFIVLNISGLIARGIDQRPEYRRIVEQVQSLGLSILYLPHVIRPGDSDLEPCVELFEECGRPRDYLQRMLLSPEQVQYLAVRAEFSISGRMHLSILSLNNGTPAITLATAGKVEGLCELFRLPELTVQPVPGFGEAVAHRAVELTRGRAEVRSRIAQGLPSVRAQSLRNFGQGV